MVIKTITESKSVPFTLTLHPTNIGKPLMVPLNKFSVKKISILKPLAQPEKNL